MRVEDLPPEARRKVLAVLGEAEPARGRRKPQAAKEDRIPLTCRACGHRFPRPTVGQLSAHTAETRHGRYEMDLG